MDTIQNNDQLSSRPEHVYPIFDKMLSRSAKEQLLGQKGLMVWFTGLSGSGKSTLAVALERSCINVDCYAESWMETISVVESIII